MNASNPQTLRVKEIASFLEANATKQFYDFSEEKPPTTDVNVVADYYGVVIALDYGFWRFRDGKFEADFYMVNGKPVKGATFLWMKSKTLFTSNPSFFSLKNLRDLRGDGFIEWLCDDSGKVPFKDPKTRFNLAKDFAEQMWDHPIHKSFMEGQQKIATLAQLLERCMAYADAPFCKKAHLLAKIMERQGYWTVADPENKLPPIDYHLINMAVKLNLIEVATDITPKLAACQALSPDDEWRLRSACADAYRALGHQSGVDPYKLDDILWSESRRNCQIAPYNCKQCLFDPVCHKNVVGFPVVETYRY
jgi:hypothetical protein